MNLDCQKIADIFFEQKKKILQFQKISRWTNGKIERDRDSLFSSRFREIGNFICETSDGGIWVPVVPRRKILIQESPDKVNDFYDRQSYSKNTHLTIRSNNGIYYSPYKYTTTHSNLIRKLKDILSKKPFFGKPDLGPIMAWGDVSNDYRKLDFSRAGVIMPMQRDMDASYISVWCSDNEDPRSPEAVFIDNCHQVANILGVPKPILLEYSETGDLAESEKFLLKTLER